MTVFSPPDVSRETQLLLEQYTALIAKWNAKINLIGDEKNIWNRHIWDAYQLIALMPQSAKTCVDLGSGAGLPGIVIAVATSLDVTLVERDERKAAFLREAARVLGLKNVTVLQKNARDINGTYDVILARALTSLTELCALSAPLMGTSSICLFPKGATFASELEETRGGWSFESQLIPSRTKEKSIIISISELRKNEERASA